MNSRVYILAGGRSARFGTDKALAEVGGAPLIVRQATTLRQAGYEVLAVAEGAGKYATLGIETVGDVVPGMGPLGGLLTALQHTISTGGNWVTLTSCDLLEIRPAWLAQLTAEVREDRQAVCFRSTLWQPLPGLYAASLLDEVRRRVDRRELALWRLLDAVKSVGLPLPGDWPATAQANTPEDLRQFIERKNNEERPGAGQ